MKLVIFLILAMLILIIPSAYSQSCGVQGHCGSGVCDAGEDCDTCPQDCICDPQETCGACRSCADDSRYRWCTGGQYGAGQCVQDCNACDCGGGPPPEPPPGPGCVPNQGQACNCNSCGCGGTIQCSGACSGAAPVCNNPIGFHDVSDCTASYGWTCDADNFNQPLDVHFYREGGVFIGATTANWPAEPGVAAACGGNPNHRFIFNTPTSIKDGATHNITVYAINIGLGTGNPPLTGTPKTIDCCTPPSGLSPQGNTFLLSPLVTLSWIRSLGSTFYNVRLDDGTSQRYDDPRFTTCPNSPHYYCENDIPNSLYPPITNVPVQYGRTYTYWVDESNGCTSGGVTFRACASSGETSCTDGLDNDCNGLTDCADPRCSPDIYSNCCTPSVDKTSGLPWTSSNHQDAGISFNSNLFNSNGAACSVASGGSCFDANNNPVNHKLALTSGNCCGNNVNEFYKPDYYGPECTNDVNDCVWSTGDAQVSNTGNARLWCYIHEWYDCDDVNDIGKDAGGVCCAGTSSNFAWTPDSLVIRENQYSCSDGKDNDCDGLTDCNDTDCDGTMTGTVRSQSTQQPISLADVTAKLGFTNFKSTITNQQGIYSTKIQCGNTYNLVASHPDYVPQAKSNIAVAPLQTVTNNFDLVIGTSCESDCTFAADNIIHASCDGKNGCTFYDNISKAACDLAQPVWLRDYNSSHYVICAPGAPQPKIQIEASISCSSGTLVKVTRIVVYNGKPVKLVVATCG